jgi:demethylmenaquinone methyltransferase/2-methoxy-6-polyprenyl-1,4-benzoquinol methylase
MVPSDATKAPPAWEAESLRDPHAQRDKAIRVRAMFDAIAPTYERVNTLATFGRDSTWRRRAVLAARVAPQDVVLDVCCGTGDMIRAFAASSPPPSAIIGADFSLQMLARGRYQWITVPIQLCRADGLRLPLRDASVDVLSCAFGVRNFNDLQAGLAEMRRVLKPGGRVVILEFAPPENPWLRWANGVYCKHVLPLLGRFISRDRTGAYQYLPRSIETFDTRSSMEARLRHTGFRSVRSDAMNFGGVVLYCASG